MLELGYLHCMRVVKKTLLCVLLDISSNYKCNDLVSLYSPPPTSSLPGVDATSSLIVWFWEVMEELTNQERSLFLRFVWGRTRLPRTIADFRGRGFVLQVLDKYNPPDHFLPESYTCFFLLKMPRYSCKAVRLIFAMFALLPSGCLAQYCSMEV